MKKQVIFLLCLFIMATIPEAAFATEKDVVILPNGQLVITNLTPQQPFEKSSEMLASDSYNKTYLATYADESDIPQTLYLSEKKVNSNIVYSGTVTLVSKTWRPADQYWLVQYEGYLYAQN